jgi:rhamnogalacturonan acetylesterase
MVINTNKQKRLVTFMAIVAKLFRALHFNAGSPVLFRVNGVILTLLIATSSGAQSQRLPTLFIIGDSTVKNSAKGLLGWGDPIAAFFDQQKIRIENRARGGRSSRTFQTEGLWDQVLSELKPGDFVLMQFGHNDGGAINDESRARGSLKGTGNETEEIDNLLTKKPEMVHTFGWYMRKYIADAKAKGAVAVVLSPIPRNVWKDGKVVRASADYGKWAAEAAKSEGAFFVDLNELVARRYDELGPDKVKELYFLEDHTHTTPAGAEVNARAVVEGLRAFDKCPLASFLLKGETK